MNAYDFDNTIYRGDSSLDFVLWCALRSPRACLRVLAALPTGALLLMGKYDKTAFKQKLFSFLSCVDAQAQLARFWAAHRHRIKAFYLAQMRPDDLIASASPEFLIRPALALLGVTQRVVGSRVDMRTGRFDGPNCWGAEKLARVQALGLQDQIDDFYSDSLSDAPLALAAKRAFLVKGERILPWPEVNHGR